MVLTWEAKVIAVVDTDAEAKWTENKKSLQTGVT